MGDAPARLEVDAALPDRVHVVAQHVRDAVRVDAADVRIQQHVRRLLGVAAWHAESDEELLDGAAHHRGVDSHLDLRGDVEAFEHWNRLTGPRALATGRWYDDGREGPPRRDSAVG